MKHDTSLAAAAILGDTADLIVCLRLTPMPTGTRIGTICSVRLVRDALAGGIELPVDVISAEVEDDDPALATSIGLRWSQVRSDIRRAIRAWGNAPRRALARRLRTSLPTLDDAMRAFSLQASPDAAKRCADAIAQLAASQETTPDQLVATAMIVEPLLRAATPETFGVRSVKDCGNKIALVRKAVSLVDPTSVSGREADLAGLPEVWVSQLARLEDAMGENATGLAIFRRLAVTGDRAGLTPATLSPAVVAEFASREIVTHAQNHDEKIRAAFRVWNASAQEAGAIVLELPATGSIRQRSVTWSSLPAAIREPLEAVLDRAISTRAPGDWGNLIGEVDTDDAELGTSLVMLGVGESPDSSEKALVIEPGTRRNWQDCIKRAYVAAMDDPKVVSKPQYLGDLYTPDIAKAMIRGVRSTRRDRSETRGESYDPQQKARYEHTLIEALCSVGRATGVDTDLLALIESIKRNIDPAIVSWKRSSEGGMKAVYAERRIGKRHADMLRQFNEQSALCRWFEAPQQHRAKLHSTNPLERVNGEIKRRTEVVGIFPNEAAITRLVGAILLEQNDGWAVQRSRYMTLETIAPIQDDPIIGLPAMAD